MENKKCEESYSDYGNPFSLDRATTSCNPDCKNLNENVKQRKKPSNKEMEEYFKMMDAMEQDLEDKYGKLDFKD